MRKRGAEHQWRYSSSHLLNSACYGAQAVSKCFWRMEYFEADILKRDFYEGTPSGRCSELLIATGQFGRIRFKSLITLSLSTRCVDHVCKYLLSLHSEGVESIGCDSDWHLLVASGQPLIRLMARGG